MSLWMIWLLPGTRTCNIFINGWLSIGWRTKLLLQEMVGNHPFHPLKNWLFRVPGEFRVFRQWFVLPTQVAGWFQGTRAHLRRCDQATWWFDRIDKDCFVLFVCLLACLFVCLFVFVVFSRRTTKSVIYAQKWLRILSQAHIVTSVYAFKCFSTLSSGCN